MTGRECEQALAAWLIVGVAMLAAWALVGLGAWLDGMGLLP